MLVEWAKLKRDYVNVRFNGSRYFSSRMQEKNNVNNSAKAAAVVSLRTMSQGMLEMI